MLRSILPGVLCVVVPLFLTGSCNQRRDAPNQPKAIKPPISSPNLIKTYEDTATNSFLTLKNDAVCEVQITGTLYKSCDYALNGNALLIKADKKLFHAVVDENQILLNSDEKKPNPPSAQNSLVLKLKK